MSNIRTTADELHEAFPDYFPVTASTLGFPGRDHLLTDHGGTAEEAFAAVLRDIIARALGEGRAPLPVVADLVDEWIGTCR